MAYKADASDPLYVEAMARPDKYAGLVCHLTRWTTPEQLRAGAVAGHVICQTQEPYLLTENVEAVPVWAI